MLKRYTLSILLLSLIIPFLVEARAPIVPPPPHAIVKETAHRHLDSALFKLNNLRWAECLDSTSYHLVNLEQYQYVADIEQVSVEIKQKIDSCKQVKKDLQSSGEFATKKGKPQKELHRVEIQIKRFKEELKKTQEQLKDFKTYNNLKELLTLYLDELLDGQKTKVDSTVVAEILHDKLKGIEECYRSRQSPPRDSTEYVKSFGQICRLLTDSYRHGLLLHQELWLHYAPNVGTTNVGMHRQGIKGSTVKLPRYILDQIHQEMESILVLLGGTLCPIKQDSISYRWVKLEPYKKLVTLEQEVTELYQKKNSIHQALLNNPEADKKNIQNYNKIKQQIEETQKRLGQLRIYQFRRQLTSWIDNLLEQQITPMDSLRMSAYLQIQMQEGMDHYLSESVHSKDSIEYYHSLYRISNLLIPLYNKAINRHQLLSEYYTPKLQQKKRKPIVEEQKTATEAPVEEFGVYGEKYPDILCPMDSLVSYFQEGRLDLLKKIYGKLDDLFDVVYQKDSNSPVIKSIAKRMVISESLLLLASDASDIDRVLTGEASTLSLSARKALSARDSLANHYYLSNTAPNLADEYLLPRWKRLLRMDSVRNVLVSHLLKLESCTNDYARKQQIEQYNKNEYSNTTDYKLLDSMRRVYATPQRQDYIMGICNIYGFVPKLEEELLLIDVLNVLDRKVTSVPDVFKVNEQVVKSFLSTKGDRLTRLTFQLLYSSYLGAGDSKSSIACQVVKELEQCGFKHTRLPDGYMSFYSLFAKVLQDHSKSIYNSPIKKTKP